MSRLSFKTAVAAWWVFSILILCFGFYLKANAQVVFGSPQAVITAYRYLNITGQTTTVVKSGGGILHTICVNTPAATETITVYDNTAASGTKIGTVTVFAATNPCLTYDVNFTTGLTIVTATASSDLTVSYY
jgi:hypothetical protein